jgi:hypothetical protein
MSMQLDSRMAAAIGDGNASRRLLDDLHFRIVSCRDTQSLSELLSRYVAVASACCRPATGANPANLLAAIARIMKQSHDALQSILQNIRA